MLQKHMNKHKHLRKSVLPVKTGSEKIGDWQVKRLTTCTTFAYTYALRDSSEHLVKDFISMMKRRAVITLEFFSCFSQMEDDFMEVYSALDDVSNQLHGMEMSQPHKAPYEVLYQVGFERNLLCCVAFAATLVHKPSRPILDQKHALSSWTEQFEHN